MLALLISAAVQVAGCDPAAGFDTVSAHLEALREADQADRREGFGPHVAERDRERLSVAKAYVEAGCLETGRDHHNVALLHQHGREPDDYRDAWFHAVRAVELGDADAAWLIPRAIDRYFMRLGYKQLYATNSRGERREEGEGFVMCLWPSAEAVTEAEREALGVRTIEAQLARIAEANGEEEGRICGTDAQDPPRGVFDGYW